MQTGGHIQRLPAFLRCEQRFSRHLKAHQSVPEGSSVGKRRPVSR